MKKNTKIIISVIAVLIVVGSVGFAATRSAEVSDYERAGSLYRAADGAQSTELAAEYRGEKLTMASLEYQRKVARDTTSSDYELAYKLMGSAILYQYAAANGCGAAPEEVEETVQFQRETYETEDGRRDMDEYLTAAGLTFDEYIALVEQQVPRTIARNKLKARFAEEFCTENGYEYDKNHLPFGAQEYIDAKLEQIIADAQSEVTYYVPVTG